MKTIKVDHLTAAHAQAAISNYLKGLEAQHKKAADKKDKINCIRLIEEIDGLRNMLAALDE